MMHTENDAPKAEEGMTVDGQLQGIGAWCDVGDGQEGAEISVLYWGNASDGDDLVLDTDFDDYGVREPKP